MTAAAAREDVVRGLAHAAAGRAGAALRAFDRALIRDPRHLVARQGRATALMALGSYDQACVAARQILADRRGSRWWKRHVDGPDDEAFAWASAVKLRHDREQLRHLAARGLLPAGAEHLEGAYGGVLDEIGQGGANRVVRLTAGQAARIGAGYNRVLHLDPGDRVAPRAVATTWDPAAAAAAYGARRLAVVDGLLTPAALAGLRRFCLDSTIWFDAAHARGGRGYIGADGMDGLVCPLLFQIAEELRQALPEVIGALPLVKLWAFKYDHALQGIDAHADAARVNVNFWITPDAACLDPSAGGLVVYDAGVPADWGFGAYNADPGALMRHVRAAGGQPTHVPYRQNRAVIFSSDLVHATAALRFRPGYLHRRINVTLLYGHRP